MYFAVNFIINLFNIGNVLLCVIYLTLTYLCMLHDIALYRVSLEEYARLRESDPYVKVYRYEPKHLYPNVNGYGDNGQRKLWSSCGSTYCTWSADACTARTLSSVM